MSTLHQISGCQNSARKADVIFLHGLGGDPFNTWRHGKDESTSWPHWLGKEFPEVGIWSLGYAASPTKWMRPVGWLLSKFSNDWQDAGHAMSLPDRASQVLDLIAQRGIGDRPILFICHSLGGLLTKYILRKAEDATDQPEQHAVWLNARGVLFLATPHNGALGASFLDTFPKLFGTTINIEDLREHDAHLRDLYNWYLKHATPPKIQTSTYFETRPVKGIAPIVNPTSSHPGVGTEPVPLDEDHLSIAKPHEKDSQVCGEARALLRKYVLISRPEDPSGSARVAQAIPNSPSTPTQTVVVKVDHGGMPSPKMEQRPLELPPAATTQFFGRTTQVDLLISRLRNKKSSSVVGPAGMGKTALAAKAVEAVVGQTPESLANSPFPDGVIFIDFYTFKGQADPAWHMLANKLSGANFQETSPARDRATEVCRGRNILLIIEGGEEADGMEGRSRISDFLSVCSSENRSLLLTRDSSQATAAETVRLDTALNHTDAESLFDALTEGHVTGTVRDQILTLLEGHPLALTWAGNLLGRRDEDPARLASEWESQTLKGLSDPVQAEHTLQWLFNRSIRGLDHTAINALTAAG